jgi:solute carrier family 7 (L-type amino acid transporter), member 9/15
LFAIFVACSGFSSVNASSYTVARLIHAAGEQTHLPSAFSVLHSTLATPMRALLLHGTLTSIMIILGTFQSLIMFSGILEWSWLFVHQPARPKEVNCQTTVLGVLILRRREPDLERPFRVPLIMPLIVCCAAFLSAFRGIFSAPIQGLCAAIFTAVEVGIYYTFVDGLRYRPAFLVEPIYNPPR